MVDGVKLQQENAPCHKSAYTMTLFRENCIELLDWPAQFPDLNPIEDLWDLLKAKIRRHSINNKGELKRCLRLEWTAITPKEYRNLTNSEPKRISAEIRSKGGPTNY